MKIGLIARCEIARGIAIQSSIEKFEARVVLDGDCWRWMGHISATHGYGIFYAEGRQHLAHRWAYWVTVAEINPGLVLDHLCRNRWCVNPAHLEAVTIGENVRRGAGVTARHARATHCPKGHEYDEVNTYRDKMNGRHCRRCRADRSLALYYERKNDAPRVDRAL